MNSNKSVKSNIVPKKFFGTSPPINDSGTTVTVDGSVSPPAGSVKINQPIPCC